MPILQEEDTLFVPFTMSEENTTAAPAAPAVVEETGVSPQVKELESMVRQTDLLKEQLNEAHRAREAAEKSKASALAEEERAELQRLRDAERSRLEAYARDNLPKAEEYIKFLEANGTQLADEDKAAYRRAFTNPDDRFKRASQRFLNEMERDRQHAVQLAASKKEIEEKEAILKQEQEKALAEKKKLTELITHGSGNMRASYAAMLANKQQQQEEPIVEKAAVAASRLNPGEILMPKPDQHARDFMSMYNWTDKLGVNASNAEDDPWAPEERLYRESMPAIPVHRQLKSQEGELQFPNSKRYTDPTIFSWLVNESGLPQADNLSQYVTLNASRTFTEMKAVDDRPGMTRN